MCDILHRGTLDESVRDSTPRECTLGGDTGCTLTMIVTFQTVMSEASRTVSAKFLLASIYFGICTRKFQLK